MQIHIGGLILTNLNLTGPRTTLLVFGKVVGLAGMQDAKRQEKEEGISPFHHQQPRVTLVLLTPTSFHWSGPLDCIVRWQPVRRREHRVPVTFGNSRWRCVLSWALPTLSFSFRLSCLDYLHNHVKAHARTHTHRVHAQSVFLNTTSEKISVYTYSPLPNPLFRVRKQTGVKNSNLPCHFDLLIGCWAKKGSRGRRGAFGRVRGSGWRWRLRDGWCGGRDLELGRGGDWRPEYVQTWLQCPRLEPLQTFINLAARRVSFGLAAAGTSPDGLVSLSLSGGFAADDTLPK